MGGVLWLDRPPFLRWLAAVLLVIVAAWSELAPSPTTRSAFLVADVAAGTPLEDHHVELRSVPVGVVATVEPTGVAATDLRAGDPLVGSMVAEVVVPPGWVVIETAVPAHASPGASATAIIVGEGSAPIELPAVVVGASRSDPFGEASGTLAVPGEWTGPAATAAAEGRLVIGVESGGQ